MSKATERQEPKRIYQGSWSDSGEEDDEKVNNEACLVAQEPNEICLGVDLEPDEWIKDSGCSKHMRGNRKLFFTYKAYDGGNVIFGSNLRGNIIGKGAISNDSLNIDNVEHVDNLGFNLLSIGQICDNKCRVTFSEYDSEITKDGKVIADVIVLFKEVKSLRSTQAQLTQQLNESFEGKSSAEICLGVDLEPDEWIKDSRCSKHMTGNRKIFSTYKAYNGGNVIFGSNLRGNIIGKGTISNDSLNIDNVEHVDNLGFNLLSIGQICDNKCRVTFSEYDSEITKDGKVIGRGIRKKGLYVMKLGNKPKDKICLATIDENSTLWHRRLGHANMRLIQSLASKELVRNLPKLKFDQHFCDACKIGKQAHASHKAKNIVSTTRCLELLHMDLFGPSAVRSYGGNRYTLVIVDDYSRYTWTRFLKDKTEAFDQF
ncbi:retrovirus-related pol polyprotein from transposon TNT 1-94, partial [Tanacetum coccineum]